MKVFCFWEGGFASNTYLITDEGGKNGVIADPSASYETVCREYGTLPRISGIILTHGHFDHILQADVWREKTGAPLLIGKNDAPMLSSSALNASSELLGVSVRVQPADGFLTEGDTVSVGDEHLLVWETPGHSPGSLCFLGDTFLLSGDTMFAGNYGRYDLPGGDYAVLTASLKRLSSLPDDTRIFPGHGRDTYIQFEKPRYIDR
ncbi:MAG: MBL fold metallo-hydrolase [Clostridia bacterium]|nr:MBL fold metallo-hydrolase [Clostridia bacterium]